MRVGGSRKPSPSPVNHRSSTRRPHQRHGLSNEGSVDSRLVVYGNCSRPCRDSGHGPRRQLRRVHELLHRAWWTRQRGPIQIDGMNVGSAFNGGGVAGFGYPVASRRRFRSRIAGASAMSIAAVRSSTSFRRQAGTRSAARFPARRKVVAGRQPHRRVEELWSDERSALIKNWTLTLRWAVHHPGPLWFFNNVRSYGNQQEIPVCSATSTPA